MEYQVPQYLEVEDKVIGPLTLKQFVYLAGGGGLLLLLFRILKFPVFIIFAIPICGLVYALAFYKVAGRSFIKVIGTLFGFIGKPSLYIWKKKLPKPKVLAEKEKKVSEFIKKKPPPLKEIPKSKLEETQWRIDIEK